MCSSAVEQVCKEAAGLPVVAASWAMPVCLSVVAWWCLVELLLACTAGFITNAGRACRFHAAFVVMVVAVVVVGRLLGVCGRLTALHAHELGMPWDAGDSTSVPLEGRG